MSELVVLMLLAWGAHALESKWPTAHSVAKVRILLQHLFINENS